MATAFFPDMDGVGIEAGWTPRNMALRKNGHDVGVNDYDVVIHFDPCRKCEEASMREYEAREAERAREEMDYWDSEFEKYIAAEGDEYSD